MKELKLELPGLVAVFAVLTASPAQAQVTPLASAVQATPKAESRKTIEASLATLYDSNIAQGSDEALARRGLEKSDFRVTPGASFDIYRTLGTGYVSLSGFAGYDIHARNTELNRERIDTTAGFGAQLSVCGVAVSAGYSRRQSNLGDLNVLLPGTGTTNRNTETTASINGTLTCGGAYGFRTLVIGGYSDARNSALLRQVSNNHARTVGGGVEYLQPAIGRIRLYGLEREINFFRRDGLNFLGAPRVISRAGTISFDRDIGARLSTSVALTYADVKSRGAAVNSGFQGLLWDAKIGLRASSRLEFELSTTRSVDPSQGFNVDYIQSKNFGLKATYVLSQRASVILTGRHLTQDYIYSTTATLREINDRTTNMFEARLKLAASDRYSFSFDGGYTNVDSDNSLFRYDSLRAGVTFSATFN